MTSLFLIIFGMAVGLSSGVVLTSLLFAAKQADLRSDEDFQHLARFKSV